MPLKWEIVCKDVQRTKIHMSGFCAPTDLTEIIAFWRVYNFTKPYGRIREVSVKHFGHIIH